MAKTKISEFSPTPGNNTDIDNINIAEGCAPSGINDAIRELMAQLKDFQAGTAGDSFNGPIGSTTAVTGAFTNITASGTLGVTGVATLGNGAVLGTPTSVTLTNGTGLPIATGVSGLGTGVATALAVNVGSAGAPVLFNGALGTPASGTVTNLTGTASININGTVGATTANTGAFTTLSASSTVTLSGGAANGVAYLNGSKVLTSGSALTFDGSLLNTTGSIRAQTSLFVYGTGDRLNVFPQAAGSGVQLLVTNNANTDYAPLSFDGSRQVFNLFGGEQMRLTSTGLGIGTSSVTAGFKLDVNGNARIGNGSAQGFEIQPGALTFIGAYNRATSVYTPLDVAGEYLRFSTNNGAEKMRLDTSGNLGLGVTPSAWSGYGLPVLELPSGGTIVSAGTSQNLGANWYYSGGSFLYKTTAAATYFQQASGAFKWYTAPSGTAGDAISFSQSMTLDASGNLLVGGTSGSARLNVIRTATGYAVNTSFYNDSTNTAGYCALTVGQAATGSATGIIGTGGSTASNGAWQNSFVVGTQSNHSLVFTTNDTERARIDSSGNLLVGCTDTLGYNPGARLTPTSLLVTNTSGSYLAYLNRQSNDGIAIQFARNNSGVGDISVTTTATAYNTSSDYRLKENIAPMTGALAKVAALKPVTYTWKADGSAGEGFIAHELAEVCPAAVTGEKDAVDADGKPQYQGIDVSFLVGTLTAAIQELKAEFDAYKASHP